MDLNTGWWAIARERPSRPLPKHAIPIPLDCCSFQPGNTVWFIRSAYIRDSSVSKNGSKHDWSPSRSWLASGDCIAVTYVVNNLSISYQSARRWETASLPTGHLSSEMMVLAVEVKDHASGEMITMPIGYARCHPLRSPTAQQRKKQEQYDNNVDGVATASSSSVPESRSLSSMPPTRDRLNTMMPYRVMTWYRLLYSTPHRLLVPFLDKCLESRITERYILPLVCDYLS